MLPVWIIENLIIYIASDINASKLAKINNSKFWCKKEKSNKKSWVDMTLDITDKSREKKL